jgi:hypothetical protein
MQATIKPLHSAPDEYELSVDGPSPTQWINPGRYSTPQELFTVGFQGLLDIDYQQEILRLLRLNTTVNIPLEEALTLG